MIRLVRNNSGVTLIELIITIAVLALFIVPISGLFITSAKANTISQTELDATMLAQKCMEMVKSIKEIEDIDDDAFANSGKELTDSDYGNYKVIYKLTEVSSDYTSNQINAEKEVNNLVLNVKSTGVDVTTEKLDNGAINTDTVAINKQFDEAGTKKFTITLSNDGVKLKNDSTFTDIDNSGDNDLHILVKGNENIVLLVENNRDDIAYIHVSEGMNGNCEVIVTNGRVQKIINSDNEKFEKKNNQVIYKVFVEVYKEDGSTSDPTVRLEGYKIFYK